MDKYEPQKIEPKWQRAWLKSKIFQPDLDKAQKPLFNLMMFPYPSAEGLHVGNIYAFTGADIYGRFKRMQGFSVFEPIGLDGFGIHSENYALKIGEYPAKLAKKTEKTFYRQLHATGNAYAWENTLETYDPLYYKWTQWIFTKLFKAGLVERKKAAVNFCPSCKTTLSDEQVIAGLCERCKSEVEKRELEQWFFKITRYAERLDKNLDWINWSEKTKIAQKNWIGRSEGAEIVFSIPYTEYSIPVFTTRPDTIFGATFFVLAPESEWVKKITLAKYRKEVLDYVKKAKKKTELERLFAEKEKTGVFTGSYVLNPATGKKIPIWVADYVVLGYGTGAIMGVPAYDERDLEFAKTYKLKVKKVPLEDMEEIIQKIVENGWGERKVQYRLRDWCISRQRYWGPPIPMIQCKKCGWQPVPEEDLPVQLPYLSDWKPLGTGASPLAQAKDWVKTRCPKCGGPAKRETDVSDTFLDSAWYFFRYTSTDKKEVAFDKERVKKWLPVEMYIGGHEHAVLHLMYTRFLTMVFKDLGLIDFEEPFKRFYAHGLLISEGAKMSKSKGNIVIPDEYIAKYGADTLRGYLMFLGPFNQGGDFRDTGIAGMWRFLNRVWRLAVNHQSSIINHQSSIQVMHQTIKKVTEDIQNLRYNTAIASLMEFVNFLTQEKKVSRQAIETLLLLLAPFAPYLAEEIWSEVLGNKFSVHNQRWPEYDSKLVKEEMATVVIQINGKLRDKLNVKSQMSNVKSEIEKLAKKSERVKKYLAGQKIKKTVFIPGKLINFVV